MKSKIRSLRIVKLEMDENEGRALLELIQNPISEYESDEHRKLREDIWTCLEKQGIRLHR